MLTTQEINFYSHHVLLNGVAIGEIHGIIKVDPVAGTDRLMWEGWLKGTMVCEFDAFMMSFRHLQNAVKAKKKLAA